MSAKCSVVSTEDEWRRKLYVSRIPSELYNYGAFRSYFERYGKVLQCFLHPSKRFGHVNFQTHEIACRVKESAAEVRPHVTMHIGWWEREAPTTPTQYMPSAPKGGARRKNSSTAEKSVPSSLQKKMPVSPEEMQKSTSPILPHDFRKRFPQFWSTFEKLPADVGTRCLLVQNIDPSVDAQNVSMHFENKKRSNGGPVKSVTKMGDGLLVVFKNEKDCLSSFKKENQLFGGQDIRLFLKIVPTFYEDRIVVSGVSEHTAQETIELYLENCSANETSPMSCDKQGLPGVYLITYGTDYDMTETGSLLKKIDSKQLENHKLKGSRLLRTDCLKLANVPKKISDDNIRLVLESKKRASGGPVTRIDRLENDMALVYFASFIDAGNVYEKFKGSSAETLRMQFCEVAVHLYFHSLSQEHECVSYEKSPTQLGMSSEHVTAKTIKQDRLEPFYHHVDEKDKTASFIFGSNKHRNLLKYHFRDFATVFIDNSRKMGALKLTFTPAKKLVEQDFLQTQDEFNTRCVKQLRTFLLKYVSQRHQFDDSKLKSAKSLDSDLAFQGLSQDPDVTLCWGKNSLEITGLKKAVQAAFENINLSVNSVTSKLLINEGQYRTITDLSILDGIKVEYPKVHISCNDDTKTVTLSGPKAEVNEIQVETLTQLKDLLVKPLTGLPWRVMTFLTESLVLSEDSGIVDVIKKSLQRCGIKAMLCLEDGQLCIRTKSCNDYEKAISKMEELVVSEDIVTDCSNENWQRFQELECRDTSIVKAVKMVNGRIEIVGLASDVSQFKRKFNTFMEKNAMRKKLLQASYGRARYVLESTSSKFKAEYCKQMAISCSLSRTNGGGILLKGPNQSVNQCIEEMQKLFQSIEKYQLSFTAPGLQEYFNGSDGRSFLQMVEENCNCIILSHKAAKSWPADAISGRNQTVDECIPSVEKAVVHKLSPITAPTIKMASLKCQVTLLKGDIVDHCHCAEVGVTTTSPEHLLSMDGSSISKAFKEYTGSMCLRNYCDNPPSPPYGYGDVYESDGGCLVIGRIFHAIIMHYDSRLAESHIKKVVSACLYKAEKAGCDSIVFPAIGTGGFGYPAKLVARWMREEILKFSGINLRTISIVLFPTNAPVIKAFTAEFKTPLSFEMKFLPAAIQSTTSATMIGPLLVSVYDHDILYEQSDVIAVPAGVVKDARIQAELSAAGGDDFRVTHGGHFFCKKIFHVQYQDSSKKCEKMLLKILEATELFGLSSVSIQVFGSYNISPGYIRTAIETFLKKNPQPKALNLVNFLSDFHCKNALKELLFNVNRTTFMTTSGYFSTMVMPAPKLIPGHLTLFAASVDDIAKAQRRISSQVKVLQDFELIEDDALKRLTDWERWSIYQVGLENKVRITESRESSSGVLTIDGISIKVLRAQESIKAILKQFVAAENLASLVVWQKWTKSNKWVNYHPHANLILENAYTADKARRSKHFSSHSTVPHFKNGVVTEHKVDFSDVHSDHGGMKSSLIRRKTIDMDRRADDVPQFWEDMGQETCKLVKVSRQTTEFKAIYHRFCESGFSCSQILIRRIQNLSLYKQYLAKRREVAKKCRLSETQVERRLYHGTADAAKIVANGFDRSYAGKNGTLLGKGVYFATSSKYSHNFTHLDKNGYRHMLVANVITGRFCKGRQDYNVAPSSSQGVVDSVVDNITSPSIFVIFKDASAYPAYLIMYA